MASWCEGVGLVNRAGHEGGQAGVFQPLHIVPHVFHGVGEGHQRLEITLQRRTTVKIHHAALAAGRRDDVDHLGHIETLLGGEGKALTPRCHIGEGDEVVNEFQLYGIVV